MSKLQFTVDESINPKDAEEAFKNLRRMIRYGRMAERALKSIKATGYYNGITPLAPSPSSVYSSNSAQHAGKRKTDVKFSYLPKRLGISREDLGPMSELRLEFGSMNMHREIELFLVGPMAEQVENGMPEYEVSPGRRRLGTIRINKGHLSWLENAQYGTGGAWRVYKEMKYSGAKESLAAFSKGASKILVERQNQEHAFAAKTLELQAEAHAWFLADGHAERMFLEIHEMTKIIEVMQS